MNYKLRNYENTKILISRLQIEYLSQKSENFAIFFFISFFFSTFATA